LYSVPVSVVPDPNSKAILGSPNTETWTTFQDDTMELAAGGPRPYSNSSVVWSIPRGSEEKVHEVEYRLPNVSDIRPYNLVLLVHGSFQVDQLQFGLGDGSGNVGWYNAGAGADLSGWTTFAAVPSTPNTGYFDPLSTRGLFLRYFTPSGEAAQIKIGLLVVGQLVPDTVIWARALAVFSIGYVMVDRSMNLGNLTNWGDYSGGLGNASVFEPVYHGVHLDLFKNLYFTDTMFVGVSSIYKVSGFDEVYTTLQHADFQNKEPAFLLGDDSSTIDAQTIRSVNQTSTTAKIRVSSTDSSRIILSITTSGPILLVFNQAYDNGWIAYLNGSALSDHIRSTGFANAWIIDKTGESQIEIRFSMQPIMSLTIVVMVFSIMTISLLIVTLEFSKRAKNRLSRLEIDRNRQSLYSSKKED